MAARARLRARRSLFAMPMIVGSGLIAKKLYDRRKAAKTAKSGTGAKTAKDTAAT